MKITYMNSHNHAKILASNFNGYGCNLYGICNFFSFFLGVCENNIHALKVVLNKSPPFQETLMTDKG